MLGSLQFWIRANWWLSLANDEFNSREIVLVLTSDMRLGIRTMPQLPLDTRTFNPATVTEMDVL